MNIQGLLGCIFTSMQKGGVILAAPGKASSLDDDEAGKLKEKIEVLMKGNLSN